MNSEIDSKRNVIDWSKWNIKKIGIKNKINTFFIQHIFSFQNQIQLYTQNVHSHNTVTVYWWEKGWKIKFEEEKENKQKQVK